MVDQRSESGGGRRTTAPSPGHSFAGELVADILEPHASLRYVAVLFKALATLLVLLLIAELALGLLQQGRQAVPVLLVEATRLVVFAGVLWGLGDMALMFIESNHDIRATRVMMWQLNEMTKMRMQREGIAVEPVRPPAEAGEAADLDGEDES